MITQGMLIHRIEDELFSGTFYYTAADPYILSLELENFAHSLGSVHEKINSLMTTGPRRASNISFTIEKRLDKKTKLSILVTLEGEVGKEYPLSENLRLAIVSIFQSKIGPSYGFLERTYDEYYTKKISPKARAMLEIESRHIIEKLLEKMKKLTIQSKK